MGPSPGRLECREDGDSLSIVFSRGLIKDVVNKSFVAATSTLTAMKTGAAPGDC